MRLWRHYGFLTCWLDTQVTPRSCLHSRWHDVIFAWVTVGRSCDCVVRLGQTSELIHITDWLPTIYSGHPVTVNHLPTSRHACFLIGPTQQKATCRFHSVLQPMLDGSGRSSSCLSCHYQTLLGNQCLVSFYLDRIWNFELCLQILTTPPPPPPAGTQIHIIGQRTKNIRYLRKKTEISTS